MQWLDKNSSEIGQTGIPVVNCSNACATGATAFREAWTSIKTGLYDVDAWLV